MLCDAGTLRTTAVSLMRVQQYLVAVWHVESTWESDRAANRRSSYRKSHVLQTLSVLNVLLSPPKRERERERDYAPTSKNTMYSSIATDSSSISYGDVLVLPLLLLVAVALWEVPVQAVQLCTATAAVRRSHPLRPPNTKTTLM